MSRKKKKNTNILELDIALFITALVFIATQNISLTIGVLVISITLAIIIVLIRKDFKTKALLSSGITIVDKMTGEEFEQFLLAHFRNLGYSGKLTPTTNDYGADLILNNQKDVIVVQAKRWKNKVGIEAVQQIIGAKDYYKGSKCLVVTNNYFTPNAINLANSSNVELWDRNKLIEIMKNTNGKQLAETSINLSNTSNANERICPRCGGKLVLRKGKDSSTFYGCSSFPKCRYTEKV